MTGTRAAVAEPARAAAVAARAAGVSVRDLADLAELNQVVDLFATIWGRAANPPVTIELLRAFTKAGNHVSGAFDVDRLVGACVGFVHAPGGHALHSHIAGVSAAAAGRGVGFALKLHQRAWAVERDLAEIVWTFDPLVARNACFNLVKLAARPTEYLTNFYGPMADAINGDQDSDRLLVRWPLHDPAVVRACAGDPPGVDLAAEITAGAVRALDIAADGGPVPGRLDGTTSLVAVPRDVERLRATDPEMARRWRAAVRAVLTGLIEDGGRVDGFDRAGWYVVRR
ncbi:GNAT family N-acetyltransferase [Umezawaea endophytica]|uniref:GNAT family N-acetyltransferase n=1 Tax=Umezawaea endophytica TaxID=1654476 RepID=A0A9X2VGF2_9PSEU|nr:GNAT family N-acetyltransferase [Umezawaea endophytica]MCS7475642.1 GNAT family N-acetyltransferase [Umezawaea endophytica]